MALVGDVATLNLKILYLPAFLAVVHRRRNALNRDSNPIVLNLYRLDYWLTSNLGLRLASFFALLANLILFGILAASIQTANSTRETSFSISLIFFYFPRKLLKT